MKKINKAIKISTFFICCMFLLNSCNSGNSTNETTNDSTAAIEPASATDTSAASQKLKDPEIASLVLTVNQIDLNYAALAKDISKNPHVLKFADTMTKEHQSINNQAEALVKKLNITPLINPTTKSLQSSSAKALEMLNTVTGAAFDTIYIQNEVTYHKAVINLMENKLIPDATNADLKRLLQTALPIFKEHLAEAKKVQKEVVQTGNSLK